MPDINSAADVSEYIDLDSALKRVRGNKTLYRRMLGMFAKSEEFDALERALADGDISQAADLAHGIKGMAANLGMNRLSDSSAALMTSLRSGSLDEGLAAGYRESLEKTKEFSEAIAKQLEQ